MGKILKCAGMLQFVLPVFPDSLMHKTNFLVFNTDSQSFNIFLIFLIVIKT